jgi:hypothetical protein
VTRRWLRVTIERTDLWRTKRGERREGQGESPGQGRKGRGGKGVQSSPTVAKSAGLAHRHAELRRAIASLLRRLRQEDEREIEESVLGFL